VATRRIRELLPLVAPGARRWKLERKVRRLTRALGPVRELDVALETLDWLEQEGSVDIPRPALTRMRQVIRQERRERHAELLRTLSGVDLDRLRRRLARASREKRAAAAVARARSARRALRLRDAIDGAGGMYLPDRLHLVRIAVKKLRYALELAAELRGSTGSNRIATLRAAQDLLGRMHDFEVLIGRVRAVQGAPAAPDLRLSAGLDRLVRRLETECRQMHGAYMASRRTLQSICDRTIAADSARRAVSERPAA
jgi:CHAD domain-containing protein